MGSSDASKQSKCILEPINFRDESQCTELLRQRTICGWANTPDCISAWRDAMDAGLKSMFWIQSISQPGICVGHVSLDSEAEPADLELANPHDKSVMTIAHFFILPEHRKGGIGRSTIEMLERCAREEPYGSPNCRTIAITTLSRWYCEDEEGRAEFARANGTDAPPRNNEDWYARMGYIKWKDQPHYQNARPGFENYKFTAAYMRKAIG